MAETIKDTDHPQPTTTGEFAAIRSPRSPQQDRGQKRVDQILDAAEALLVEKGIDALTTNSVAERAGASVGSLYHFFPGGKDAIIEGLARRHLRQVQAINRAAMSAELATAPLPDLFHGIVMGMAHFISATPAFPQVHDFVVRAGMCGPNGSLADFEEATMETIRSYIAVRLPRLGAERRETIARVSSLAVDAVVDRAMLTTDDAERLKLLEELQRLMVCYMEPLEADFGPLPA